MGKPPLSNDPEKELERTTDVEDRGMEFVVDKMGQEHSIASCRHQGHIKRLAGTKGGLTFGQMVSPVPMLMIACQGHRGFDELKGTSSEPVVSWKQVRELGDLPFQGSDKRMDYEDSLSCQGVNPGVGRRDIIGFQGGGRHLWDVGGSLGDVLLPFPRDGIHGACPLPFPNDSTCLIGLNQTSGIFLERVLSRHMNSRIVFQFGEVVLGQVRRMFPYAVGYREFNACDSSDETGGVTGQKVTKGMVRSRGRHLFSRNTMAVGLDLI